MTKDPLFPTKLFGAALTAAWVVVASVFVSWMLYQPGHIETPAYPLGESAAVGERPTAPGASGGETQPVAESDGKEFPALLAAADADDGARVARKCSACHSFDKGGRAKVGPNLWDIVGSDVASVDGFGYSDALSGVEGNWGYEELDAFLASPREFAPGTKMTFAGIRDDGDRADLIAYLRTLSDDPKPLP